MRTMDECTTQGNSFRVHLKAKQGDHNRELADWRVYYDQDKIMTIVKAVVVNLHPEAT